MIITGITDNKNWLRDEYYFKSYLSLDDALEYLNAHKDEIKEGIKILIEVLSKEVK